MRTTNMLLNMHTNTVVCDYAAFRMGQQSHPEQLSAHEWLSYLVPTNHDGDYDIVPTCDDDDDDLVLINK